MGKASSTKKVQRLARSGGRRTQRRNRGNWVWSAGLAGVVILGVVLIVVSRNSAVGNTTPPLLGDHFHAAYGVYTCDSFQPPMNDARGDEVGIHTHADGLIHIHPISSRATGKRATFGVFAREVNLDLEDDKFELPSGQTFENGDDCGDEKGVVQLAVWDNPVDEEPTIHTVDVADVQLVENGLYTLAFVPAGTEIPKPQSIDELRAPSDLPPPVTPPLPTPSDTAPGDTTAPEGSPPPVEDPGTTAPPDAPPPTTP